MTDLPHLLPVPPDDLYTSRPPWDIDRPQPAFAALADAVTGRVLDVGCGTGEHVLMAAARGLDATGVDLAATALRTARQKAHDRGLTARFLHHDARHLADLGETFDTILDSGLFHIITTADRARYVDSLRSVLNPGGRYFMLGFSDQQDRWPGERGPHRLTRHEIAAAFADGWRVDALDRTTIEINIHPAGIRAWLLAATRV
jgi:cyclopropane fatty-acyl-phospholipid synthase-like methyltransferase